MTNPNTTEIDFEKKTERLDIRLSHNKKQAFAQACENQGDTPSNAVRRFVASYIRRENRDNVAAAVRFSPKKKWAALTACFIVFGLAGSVIWMSAKTKGQTTQAFHHYDANKNGLIDIGEIAENDTHLHRVLNIDGQDGISREEFQTKGKMVWSFVDPNSFEILEDKQNLFKQTSIVTRTMTLDGKPIDSNAPRYIKVNGELIEVPKGISVGKFIHSQNLKIDALPIQHETSPVMQMAKLKFNTKVVTFDLGDPEKMHLTIFEKQPSGLKRSVIHGHQRSVTWMEGRKTPELVMGKGRDLAVLTQADLDEG